MKFIVYLIIPLVLLSLYGGCGSGGDEDSGENCVRQNELNASECLAEDLQNVCELFFCGATFPPDDNGVQLSADFFFPPSYLENAECVVLDCNTLDCGIAGFFSDLEIGTNGRPTGFISFDQEAQFICFQN